MPTNNIQTMSITEIYLDEENPRLPTTLNRSQKSMLRYIARNTSITELMTVIAEHGYFPGEPIVVIPRESCGYCVVEGNRRLSALKLLDDPSLLATNKRIGEISKAARYRPTSVPCVIFDKRSEIVNYLGYRHISGVKQWEPLAKARYIAQYFKTETDVRSEPIERYREVARGIGSQAPYIKRQLDGIAVYYHIEDSDFYSIDGLDEESISFSLLSTAIGYESILGFVSSTDHPFLEPKKLRKRAVRDLTIWMYKPRASGETALGDSRNIQRLAVIVDDPKGLQILKDDRNLQKAFAVTKGVAVEFYDLLNEIEWGLQQANGSVALMDLDEGHMSKISNIFKQAKTLRRNAEEE